MYVDWIFFPLVTILFVLWLGIGTKLTRLVLGKHHVFRLKCLFGC